MTKFYGYDAVAMSTALEDNVQQLNLMGQVMPFSYLEEPEPLDIMNGEVEAILINNMNLQTRFLHVLSKYSNSANAMPIDDTKKQKENVCNTSFDSENHIGRRNINSPMHLERVKKVQEDRLYLQRVLGDTANQLIVDGSFQPLIEAIETEYNDDKLFRELINNEEANRVRTNDFREEVEAIKDQELDDINQRNAMIRHLKDQLQETKAKNKMQLKFGRAENFTLVDSTLKTYQATEKVLQDELMLYSEMVATEQRVRNETETWVRDYTKELQGKTEHWKQKYADDTEAIKRNTTVLSIAKARDLQRLHELSKRYTDYYAVVLEYRENKEKEEIEKQKEIKKLNQLLKIQCWWRTVCCRKAIGPYGRKRRRRGKKGDKGKGKGKSKRKW